MGRKKKEVKKEELKTKITGIQANDTTGYEGRVILKIQKDGKILKTIKSKNKGTLRLFQGIALALQNTSSSVLFGSFLPQYLDAGSGSLETNLTDTKLNNSILKANRVPLNPLYPTKNNIDNPKGYISKFVGVIPYSLIGDSTIEELGLFADKSGDTLLARILLGEGIQIASGMNLIVEWNLDITNK